MPNVTPTEVKLYGMGGEITTNPTTSPIIQITAKVPNTTGHVVAFYKGNVEIATAATVNSIASISVNIGAGAITAINRGIASEARPAEFTDYPKKHYYYC